MISLEQDLQTAIKVNKTGFEYIPYEIKQKTSRSKSLVWSQVINLNAHKLFLIPYYNLMNIGIGTGIDQRVSSAIDIKNIELNIGIRPDPSQAYQNNAPSYSLNTLILSDGRVRIVATCQKKMVSYFPIDDALTFPFYSTTATANNPQPLTPPNINTTSALNLMFLQPLEQTHMIIHDETYNMSNYNTPSLQFTEELEINKRFDYDGISGNQIPINDPEIWYNMPQFWICIPKQEIWNTPATYPSYLFEFSVRLNYDSLN